MSGIKRREALSLLATAPLVAALPAPLRPPMDPAVDRAARAAERAVRQGVFEPRFLTPHELHTVRVLGDLIIPRDSRSGNASDAGVPEFIDFTLDDRPYLQTPIRGGLRWLDTESRGRFGTTFVDAGATRQREILDQIAWPERAAPELSQGVSFFNRFRDLVATGFFTSRIGIEDLAYKGNTYVAEWTGCPDEALHHLGVSYREE